MRMSGTPLYFIYIFYLLKQQRAQRASCRLRKRKTNKHYLYTLFTKYKKRKKTLTPHEHYYIKFTVQKLCCRSYYSFFYLRRRPEKSPSGTRPNFATCLEVSHI